MKKIISLITAFVCLPLVMMAQNDGIEMSVTKASQTEYTLNVSLNNPTNKYGAFQIDLVLPSGFSADGNSITASSRLSNITLQGNIQASGLLRVVGYASKTTSSITGTSGDIISIKMTADETVTSGEYEITAKNVRFTTSTGVENLLPGITRNFTVTTEVEKYKLTYYNESIVYATFDVAQGDSLPTVDEPAAKTGYTFCGWGDVPAVMPSHDVDLNATWCPIQYKVIYKSDGQKIDSVMVAYGSALPDYKPSVTKEGHTFCGWSGAPEKMPANNIELEATWCVIYYKLNYYVGEELVNEETVAYGAELPNYTPKEEIEGYKFAGWEDAPETMPASDLDLQATWAKNKYAVNYYVDDMLIHTDSVLYDDPVEQYEYVVEDPAHYVFSGWTGDTYDKMPAKNISYTGNVYMLGDVNLDGSLNAADVVSVYNFILVGEQSGTKRINADVNGDGSVNGSDVTSIYNLIVYGSASSQAKAVGNEVEELSE